MAFALRKMLSNINYFKKEEFSDVAEDSSSAKKRRHISDDSTGDVIKYPGTENSEPDSTSKTVTTSFDSPKSVKTFSAKKGSLSDTDLLTINLSSPSKKDRRRNKKLKLDIMKANKSMSDSLDIPLTRYNRDCNAENTPKHISLACKSSEIFSRRLEEYDFNKSFDLFDAMSVNHLSSDDENCDIHSLSDNSDTDVSIIAEEKADIKMCRKVDDSMNTQHVILRSTTPESFGDVEFERNEEERISLLHSYQSKLETVSHFLKDLFTEFKFHIEVSKIFHSKSIVAEFPGSDNLLKLQCNKVSANNISRGVSPEPWNLVMENEDIVTKQVLQNQMQSMKNMIEEFLNVYFENCHSSKPEKASVVSKTKTLTKTMCIDLQKHKKSVEKRMRVNSKKKLKRYNDYPDLKEALQNLFSIESECDSDNDSSVSINNVTDLLSNIEERDNKYVCRCLHHHNSSPISQTDSGLITKGEDVSSHSISSSIGNFSLDNLTLTAYSESLDQIISYNSFEDTSLYGIILQKAAIERITFYIQVHSIQLRCNEVESESGVKIQMNFFCPACSITENEEQGVLMHILSEPHCERIHFLYKTAYIKKCFKAAKEIQPSTVLNSMTMYRDVNKIVCFGDAKYACSLCFDTLIVGESVLMGHCGSKEHVERREKLSEMLM